MDRLRKERAFMPVVSSVLSPCLRFGLCLVWYRLRNLDRQVGRLEEISVYDPLTGLRSGRLFESECAISCRGPGPVAVLLLIDLDNFRRFKRRRLSRGTIGACWRRACCQTACADGPIACIACTPPG